MTTRDEIVTKLVEIIAEKPDLQRAAVQLEGDIEQARFTTDLGFDSLDLVGFLFACEEVLGVRIPEEDVNHETHRFGGLVDYLLERVNR